MKRSTPNSDIPDDVYMRATELSNEGMAFSKAVGKAVDEMRYVDTDWTLEEVADGMDVSPSTLKTYMSKAKHDTESSLSLFIMTFGGSRTILSSVTDSYYYDKKYFLVGEFGMRDDDTYTSAKNGDGKVALIEAEGGSMNGPTIDINIETTGSHESLGAFIKHEYVDKEFGSMEKTSLMYNLLVEAGVEEDSIPKPGESLHPSHPDSADHFQYQMRSLEPPESRRPSRR